MGAGQGPHPGRGLGRAECSQQPLGPLDGTAVGDVHQRLEGCIALREEGGGGVRACGCPQPHGLDDPLRAWPGGAERSGGGGFAGREGESSSLSLLRAPQAL